MSQGIRRPAGVLDNVWQISLPLAEGGGKENAVGNIDGNKDTGSKKGFFHSKGITYFDKKTERTIFFILTIIMLLWGILTKLGVM